MRKMNERVRQKEKKYRDSERDRKRKRRKREIKKERELEKGQTAPTLLGKYRNVLLSEAEQETLQRDFPLHWQEYVERLSEYIASTGKKYENHAATISRWAKADNKQSNIPTYTYREGESL